MGTDSIYATKANTNNHIGVPQNLLNLTENHKFCIIEMGTNHPGEIEVLAAIAEPDIAVITSIGNAHLEFFKSLDAIAEEKGSVLPYLASDGVAILPGECEQLKILENCAIGKKVLSFGSKNKNDIICEYKGGNLGGSNFKLSIPEQNLSRDLNWSIAGAHQAMNAAAAATVGIAANLPFSTICTGLANCRLPGMRMRVTENNGAFWINDAYNANLDSMKAGIEWLKEFSAPENTVLVLGDFLEMGDSSASTHTEAIEFATQLFPGARIYLIGEAMTQAASEFSGMITKCFPNSADAASEIQSNISPRECIYLKGSRGIKLELIEPV